MKLMVVGMVKERGHLSPLSSADGSVCKILAATLLVQLTDSFREVEGITISTG